MNTVLRFAEVPQERIEEIKADIEKHILPEVERWSPRPRTTFSIDLSDLKDHRAHFTEVVDELARLVPLVQKWRGSVESIFVDIGLYTKEPSSDLNAPLRYCDFPIDQRLMKFCCEHQIWINLTIYGAHLEE